MRRSFACSFALVACACSSKNPTDPKDAGAIVLDATPDEDAGSDLDAAPIDSGPAAPYTLTAFDAIRIGSLDTDEHFHTARAAVDFTGAPFASVRLIVALDTTCFPFESWQSNPPPPGHSFPADCDAFDRNFELSLARDGLPPLELMRAITPFGGPLDLDLDVTDVANGLPGASELEVRIPTYSDGSGQVTGAHGGWNVTARFEVTPGPAPRRVLAVQPLFYFSTAATSTAAFMIETPPGAVAGRIELRATGHGGGPIQSDCIGPAEEFCRRAFVIDIDGGFETVEPWRDDCDELCTTAHFGPINGGFDYCAENPTGLPQSVRAPRANWCPGSLTPPFVFDRPELGVPGPHSFSWTIDSADPSWTGVPAGGSWVLSGVFFAYGD